MLTDIFEKETSSVSPEFIIKNINTLPFSYLGNKKKLLLNIYSILKEQNIEFNSILDCCSGSGVVSLFFKLLGKKVISNDIMQYAYMQSKCLVENNSIYLTNDETNYLLLNKNNNSTNFVKQHYMSKLVNKNAISSKFTDFEADFLDNFRANIEDLNCSYKKAIAFSAMNAVISRLPFGNLDLSFDVLRHRQKQIKNYGKEADTTDRRIGIYYDNNLNLDFIKWFRKYAYGRINTFIRNKGPKASIVCKSTCEDVSNIIEKIRLIYGIPDCLYFDPPYGNRSSDYLTMYRFYEEYIKQKNVYNDSNFIVSTKKFLKNNHEENLTIFLKKATMIKTWLFSYSNQSWSSIENISSIMKQFKNSVEVFVLNEEYQYSGKPNKNKEYLIVAK